MNGRYGRTAAATSSAAAAGAWRRCCCHTASKNTGAIAIIVVRATISSPQTIAAASQRPLAASQANTASSGQYDGVWAIDANPRTSGLVVSAPSMINAAVAELYRPRDADATA